MGQQVNFYFTPSDLEALERALCARLPLKILPSRLHAQCLEFLPNMEIELMGKTPLIIYLARPEDEARIRLQEIERQECWVIDDLRSPVVECSRCFFNGQLLRRGRVFFDDGYYENNQWIQKDPAFLSWAQDILAVTKSVSTQQSKEVGRLGPEAARLLDSGTITLDKL